MAQQIIDIGLAPDDGTGDPARTAFDKCNNNFGELYDRGGSVSQARWAFDQNNTAAADPGAGVMRYNDSLMQDVTEIYISEATGTGADATVYLAALTTGDIVQFSQRSDESVYQVFELTGDAVDNGGWVTIPVAHRDGLLRPAHGSVCAGVFSYPGAPGSPGGASGNIQYNDGAGGFAGDAGLNWDGSMLHVLGDIEFSALRDVNENELLTTTTTASAVNHVNITNAAAGTGPTISAVGDDANVALNLTPKGAAGVAISNASVNSLNGATAASIGGPSANMDWSQDYAALYLTNTNQTNNNWVKLSFADGPLAPLSSAIMAQITNHTSNYGDLHFVTRTASGASERLSIVSALVGINNTTPTAQLQVTNDVISQPGLIVEAAAGQTANIVEVNSNGGSGGDLVKVESDGDVFTATGVFGQNANQRVRLDAAFGAELAYSSNDRCFIGNGRNYFYSGGSPVFNMRSDGAGVYSGKLLGFYSGAGPVENTLDAALARAGAGTVEVNTGTAGVLGTLKAAAVEVTNDVISQPGLIVEAAAGQTANIFEINSNGGSGGDLFKIGRAGIVTINGDLRASNWVNIAGSASATNNQIAARSGEVRLGDTVVLAWDSNVSAGEGARDAGLASPSPGTVEVNNGIAGVLGTLLATQVNVQAVAGTTGFVAERTDEPGKKVALFAGTNNSVFEFDNTGNFTIKSHQKASVGLGTGTNRLIVEGATGYVNATSAFKATDVGDDPPAEAGNGFLYAKGGELWVRGQGTASQISSHDKAGHWILRDMMPDGRTRTINLERFLLDHPEFEKYVEYE